MGREERLNLLFGDNDPLLQINTHLTAPVSSTIAVQENPPEKKKEDGPAPQPETAPAETTEAKPISPYPALLAEIKPAGPTKPKSEKVQQDRVNPAGSFCPLLAVSRYPYRYFQGELSQRIASQFFDRNKFWERCWNLYYMLVPPHIGSRPLLLVPTTQVETLFKEINCALESTCAIPISTGFVLDFQVEGLPQPGFLGQCTSRDMKDYLESQIDAMPYHGESLDPAIPEHQAFELKLEAAVNMTKNKKTTSKAKKQQARVQTEHHWIQCLKRIQEYFGLRDATDGETFDEQCEAVAPDIDHPPSYPFHREPVFISVDVECNERCHTQITEIGVSVLDTLNLADTCPGLKASNWTSKIHSRHLRVREYGHIVNHDFVAGCPGRFEFGDSEWVSETDVPSVVEECFQYFLRQNRNVILVGHNPAADVKYFQQLHVPLFIETKAKPPLLETVDTAEVFRVSRREMSPRSLGNILAGLGVTGWYLHNAGNDARYTMEAMVMAAVLCPPITSEAPVNVTSSE